VIYLADRLVPKDNGNTFKRCGEGIVRIVGIPAQVWRVVLYYIKNIGGGKGVSRGRDFSREFASDTINSMIVNAKNGTRSRL